MGHRKGVPFYCQRIREAFKKERRHALSLQSANPQSSYFTLGNPSAENGFTSFTHSIHDKSWSKFKSIPLQQKRTPKGVPFCWRRIREAFLKKRTSPRLMLTSRQGLGSFAYSIRVKATKQVQILTHSNKKGHPKVSHFVGGESEIRTIIKFNNYRALCNFRHLFDAFILRLTFC